MKKTLRLVALVLSIFIFAACGSTAEVKTDDKGDYILTATMEEGTKAEVNVISDAILDALSEKDGAKIAKYMDADTQITEEQITEIFKQITEGVTKEYKLWDSYYIDNAKVSDVSIRVKKTDDAKDYVILTPSSEEMCILLFQGEKGEVSNIMTFITARVDGDMKIVWMDYTDYSYYGKTAFEYFELAKEANENNREFTGYIYTQMMNGISCPGNIYFYDETEKMQEYAYEISAWGQKQFPIELDGGKYKIHQVSTTLDNYEVIPSILFEAIDADSEDAAKLAELVKDAFLKKYPYIAEDFDKIAVTNAEKLTAENRFVFKLK